MKIITAFLLFLFYLLPATKNYVCACDRQNELESFYVTKKLNFSLVERGTVGKKVKAFEEIISTIEKDNDKDNHPKRSDESKIVTPGHVSKVANLFRSKSASQLHKSSPEAKLSSVKYSKGASSVSSSPKLQNAFRNESISTSPKSPHSLKNWRTHFAELSRSFQHLSKMGESKSITKNKGSDRKNKKDIEFSSPTVNRKLTQEHRFSMSLLEEELKLKIRKFDMVSDIVKCHLERGTIKKTDEKYTEVFIDDFRQLQYMHVEALQYLKGKNSIRKHSQDDAMTITNHIQNMGRWLKIVGDEILWITGDLESPVLDTKLNDIKLLKLKGDTPEESDLKIMITHPTRKSRSNTVATRPVKPSPRLVKLRSQTQDSYQLSRNIDTNTDKK